MTILFLVLLLVSVAGLAAAGDGSDLNFKALPIAVVVGFIGKYATDVAKAILTQVVRLFSKKADPISGAWIHVLAFAVCMGGTYLYCEIPGVETLWNLGLALNATLSAIGWRQVEKKSLKINP